MDGVPDTCGGVAMNYCSTAANSVDPVGATIRHLGSLKVSENNFMLEASPVPNSFGLFYFGPDQTSVPFGDGFRCVTGPTFRFLFAIASGNVARQLVDFEAPGTVDSQIDAGETWNFQYWYRDVNGPGGTALNLSDGLNVFFGL